MSELELRVARGMAYLDATRPGWLGAIDPNILDLSSCRRCVYGQLVGDFWLSDIGRATPSLVTDETPAVRYGFMLELERAEKEYQLLTDAWIAAIAERHARVDSSEVVTVGC